MTCYKLQGRLIKDSKEQMLLYTSFVARPSAIGGIGCSFICGFHLFGASTMGVGYIGDQKKFELWW